MFPVKQSEGALLRASRWAGFDLTASQIDQLLRFASWLADEAIPAGGLGPDEADRIIDRHVADSLTFGAAWDLPPASLIDVGSGVGLPGIPLAIALPETEVTLLDRSGRRTDLSARAIRVLRLTNAAAVQEEAREHRARYGAATARAALSPGEVAQTVRQLLEPGGVAMIGLRRGITEPELPETPADTAFRLVAVPDDVLDSPGWHLRMSAT